MFRAKRGEGEEIKKLINALDKRIKAAEGLSVRLEQGVSVLRDLADSIEAKKVEVHGYLERIDGVLKAIEEAGVGSEVRRSDSETPYQKAARLAKAGYGADVIAKQTGLPKGEVQLIVGLKKH